jgi:hypothetical protein
MYWTVVGVGVGGDVGVGASVAVDVGVVSGVQTWLMSPEVHVYV